MYNAEVGYCQGMSEIAALLLMYLNEEVSFNLQLSISTGLLKHRLGFDGSVALSWTH